MISNFSDPGPIQSIQIQPLEKEILYLLSSLRSVYWLYMVLGHNSVHQSPQSANEFAQGPGK